MLSKLAWECVAAKTAETLGSAATAQRHRYAATQLSEAP